VFNGSFAPANGALPHTHFLGRATLNARNQSFTPTLTITRVLI
jgi:hypothetical protein